MILDAIEKHLIVGPDLEESHKKFIEREGGECCWQLRVGEFRIFYTVDAESRTVTVLKIREKGRKTTEEIL